MRKLYTFNMMSLDGFFEDQDKNLEWHNTDEVFNDLAVEQLAALDLLLFGRVTYEMMAAFWPTAGEIEPRTAAFMNQTQKAVLSRTLETVEWDNTRLLKGDAVEEVRQIKQQPGKDIALFGSANLLRTLMPADLIDEHRVMINPVLLGSGTPLFQSAGGMLPLKLIKQTTFGNGNVLLYYVPATRSA